MSIQIRKNVFETNSSSSHSLTLAKGDLTTQPFSDERLRSGIVDVSLGEYHWEWKRYHKADEKIAYLLTQITDGCLPESSNKFAIMRELCEEHPEIQMLVDVVREHSGCELFVLPSSGGIDHQSARCDGAVGMELFRDKATLGAFLFNPKAYLQTGNDNSEPPWAIETDSSSEPVLYYQAHIADVPKGYSSVKVIALKGFDRSNDLEVPEFGLAFEMGGVVTSKTDAKLMSEILEKGVVTHVNWLTSGFYSEGFDKTVGSTASSVVSLFEDEGFKISPKLTIETTRVGNKGDDDTIEGHYVVQLPVSLVEKIKALDPSQHRKFKCELAISELKRSLEYQQSRSEEPSSYAKKKLNSQMNAVKKLLGQDGLQEIMDSLKEIPALKVETKKSKKIIP